MMAAAGSIIFGMDRPHSLIAQSPITRPPKGMAVVSIIMDLPHSTEVKSPITRRIGTAEASIMRSIVDQPHSLTAQSQGT
jgi:hypothetical protein